MPTFTLDESAFDTWVVVNPDEVYDEDLFVEDNVLVGPAWQAGETDTGSEIFKLVQDAFPNRVINSDTKGAAFDFTWLPATEYGDCPAYAYAVYLDGGFVLHEAWADSVDLGDFTLRGKDAVRAVLQEAVDAGNRLYAKLDQLRGSN